MASCWPAAPISSGVLLWEVSSRRSALDRRAAAHLDPAGGLEPRWHAPGRRGRDGHVYVWDAYGWHAAAAAGGTSAGRHERGLESRWDAAGLWGRRQRAWRALRVGGAAAGSVCTPSESRRGGRLRCAWGPSGEVLISGGSDGRLRWWDVQSGECVRVQEAHQGTVQALKVSPDGSKLASCGDDGAITLWDLESGEHLRTLRRDRPYERLNITGVRGLTDAQRATLRALGAFENGPAFAASPTQERTSTP